MSDTRASSYWLNQRGEQLQFDFLVHDGDVDACTSLYAKQGKNSRRGTPVVSVEVQKQPQDSVEATEKQELRAQSHVAPPRVAELRRLPVAASQIFRATQRGGLEQSTRMASSERAPTAALHREEFRCRAGHITMECVGHPSRTCAGGPAKVRGVLRVSLCAKPVSITRPASVTTPCAT
jgi:hypothetical protein